MTKAKTLVRLHIGISPEPLLLTDTVYRGRFKFRLQCMPLVPLDSYIGHVCLKKLIQFLDCSWNHEYFGSLAKLTLQATRSIHDSMNIPKVELIAYIYILL